MKLKIDLSRQGNFILAILLLHFVFFGYLSLTFEKAIGDRLLFLYQILFNPNFFISLIILFVIVFIMVLREEFFEYGIRNSIWLTPIIIGQSFIWTWIINGFFDVTIIGELFTRYEGYLTIFSILSINLFAAVLASIITQYKRRRKKLEQFGTI